MMDRIYRHDIHKLHGQSHSHAPDELFGIEINQDVPYGADYDAAKLSRPNGEPEQVLHGHETHYRRSLIDGNTKYDPNTFNIQQYRNQIQKLIDGDAETLHRKWLADNLTRWFNESVYQPYTSLKYHTLLVGALVDNYRNGHEFDDLGLALRNGNAVDYRTIFAHTGTDFVESFQLVIEPHEYGTTAKLSTNPMRNFARVWNRMPEHPWTRTSDDQRIEVIDSNLRRIMAWSTALQYLENALTRGENHA